MTGRPSPPGSPVGMMTDSELRREIRRGSEAAADEMAARREARRHVRGIDPQARLAAHHSDFGGRGSRQARGSSAA